MLELKKRIVSFIGLERVYACSSTPSRSVRGKPVDRKVDRCFSDYKPGSRFKRARNRAFGLLCYKYGESVFARVEISAFSRSYYKTFSTSGTHHRMRAPFEFDWVVSSFSSFTALWNTGSECKKMRTSKDGSLDIALKRGSVQWPWFSKNDCIYLPLLTFILGTNLSWKRDKKNSSIRPYFFVYSCKTQKEVSSTDKSAPCQALTAH